MITKAKTTLQRAYAWLLTLVVLAVDSLSARAETDPTAIITAAEGKYNAAVAIFIAAAVIGAGILFIKKGLRGRM